MTVTVDDVRTLLKDLPSEYVSDDAVQKQIDVATFIVNKEKSSRASASDVDKAVLLNAAFLTLSAYASEIERSLGVVSPSLNTLIERYKTLADMALEYVKRAGDAPYPIVDLGESLWEYVQTKYSYYSRAEG